ncbi:MAG: hypothetical protein HY841_12215 [Bacteroidetes bacterium]|nr:hypothetical protein [Bacteroidota bacterium]
MMKRFPKIILSAFFLFVSYFLSGQSASTSLVQKDTADNIIIYGDSFLFSIHEPMGWNGNVDNAKNYNANIIFYKNKEDLKKGGTIIQVLTYKKTDEEVNKDMELDINTIKEKNHDLKQQNIDASNKRFSCFAKLVYVENTFYQYIAYINPGIQFHNAFSVSMNIPKRIATKEEFSAFLDIISTLVVFKR